MALQKEIWLDAIVDGLFADNSFLSKAYSADQFVTGGKTVHIPNAGTKPQAKVGPITRPQVATELTDSELTFDIREFYTTPLYIQDADKYELSYDKRESVVRRQRGALRDAVALEMLKAWTPTDPKRVLSTTGDTAGKVKGLVRKDVLAAATLLNKEDIPQEGRYLLLDATMHEQLLENLTEAQTQAFLACADPAKGIVGKLYGFSVMMRSATGGTAIAWHEDYVCRALGACEVFAQESDPLYYGDVLSFLVRAGGSLMSKDGIGVLAIKPAQAS